MKRVACLAACCLLAGTPLARAAETRAPRPDRRPLLVVMNEVVSRMLPRLLRAPAPDSRRISVRGGLVGLGGGTPRGGEGFGVAAPPLTLFPRAGFGNSLNLDPVTGRPH
jgi:hypothetical protein